jgi:hypothetical protein
MAATNLILPVNANDAILPFYDVVISGYESTLISDYTTPYPDVLTITSPAAFVVPDFPCVQHAAPASDISTDQWTPSSGVNLYDMINEDILDRNDYISSSNYPNNDTAKLNLSSLLQPADGNVTVYVWVRKRLV